MESLTSTLRRIDRTSWAVSMAAAGLAFAILLFIDHLSGLARSIAVAGFVVLALVGLGAGIHFATLVVGAVLKHGHSGDNA